MILLMNLSFDVLDHQYHSCWKAYISDYQISGSFLRLVIISNDCRFEVLYGKCPDYRWLFLPILEIGCMQADPSDIFWNTERLESILNRRDALTIVHAIRFFLLSGDAYA